MNQLDQLKKITTVVVDSGDIELIAKYAPEDATTNPTLMLHAISLKRYSTIINQAVRYAKNRNDSNMHIMHAYDKIIVLIGVEILKFISGKVSIEVDATLSFNKQKSIDKANKLIDMFEEEGIDRSRILIKLAATWEGIQAAQVLEKQNIHCNLTLLFSFAQAQASADAGVFLISPFVGRIYDWYHVRNPQKYYQVDNDPGVISVRKIYNYYKQYNYSTIIMGASFRNKKQVLSLAGCDRLTISPNILEELTLNTDVVERKLFYVNEKQYPPMKLLESKFRWLHNQDAMAVEQLSDGIRNFSKDQKKLEMILQDKF
ncbi:MAG TPA: transaldolase [Buchnera sp. (in: enterobacteria)]|nr:transaldolase [Buchnera sp. (in: enterobacteria)]